MALGRGRDAIWWVGLVLLLSGCFSGSGGDDPTTVVLEGSIDIAPHHAVDGTVNDPGIPEPEVRNNRAADAQRIPNPAILGGFLTEEPTGRDDRGDRYAREADPIDIYRISLEAGQRVTVEVADFAAGSHEIDLFLFDRENLDTPVDTSVGPVRVQQVTAPRDGEYLVALFAFSGQSKYVLLAGQTPSLQQLALPEPLRPHLAAETRELIITMGEGAGALAPPRHDAGGRLSAQALAHASGLEVAGHGDRQHLMRMPEHLDTRQALQQLGQRRAGPASGLRLPGKPELAQALETLALDDTLLMARALARQGGVEHVSLNYVITSQSTPNDPLFDRQWHYRLINLPPAWEITRGSDAVTVAVLDNGVFLEHPDLAGNLTHDGSSGDGWDFVDRNSTPGDPGGGSSGQLDSWHGTHVSGTIGAVTNNDAGVAGVAWDVRIMPVRIINEFGRGNTFDFLQGLRYAAGLSNSSDRTPDRPADIINMSIGVASPIPGAGSLVQEICDRGIILVAAAGNTGGSDEIYPAAYPCVVSVAATDALGRRAPYSTAGSSISLAAPGGNTLADETGDGYPDGVLSTTARRSSGGLQPSYDLLQGTSMATPHAAGVFALMRALDPELSPDGLLNAISAGQLTQPPPGLDAGDRNQELGYGLLDAVRAVIHAGDGQQATLFASSYSLDFGELTGELPLRVSAAEGGSQFPLIIETDAPWLTVEPVEGEVDENSLLGEYRVTVDRTALDPGPHNSRITLRAGQETIVVNVALRVAATDVTALNAGRHYVLAVDLDTGLTVAQAETDARKGRYDFSIELEEGDYILVAGTDLDNDGFICGNGEACGMYPTLGRPDVISVPVPADRAFDFTTAFMHGVGQSLEPAVEPQARQPGTRGEGDRRSVPRELLRR